MRAARRLCRESWLFVVEQQHDLEAVRAMLGHVRIETTQTYAQIRPAQLKRAVEFCEGKALDILST